MTAARQDDNRELVKLLSALVERYPDQRFGQLLVHSGILQYEPRDRQDGTATPSLLDPFNEESRRTLHRAVKALKGPNP
ncbi:hypothetical protein [Deinococcus aquiradiocola]|uniref:Uncharacterized protein n=1 Tax=Deinococcus aquiradiocola TaxID=393059 RepID=A0A917UQ48_9DEIO|nr:hypothetical protein [Deinococcus aquiradiocola]GGJ75501.1 hypothetical protein GCM10008939_19680 [Deinococcus aquiradiocola]